MSDPGLADSDRRWPLGVSSSTNFRDVGGLRTVSGRHTVWNRLYRGGAQCLNQRDDLLRLGVRVVIDLRMPSEATTNHAAGDTTRYAFPLFDDPRPEWVEPVDQRPAAVARRYLQMAEGGATSLERVLQVLGQLDGVPAAVICTAGRDRTGIAVGLMLAALGVADDDIAHDYALSSFAGANQQGSAVAETMVTFLSLIKTEHGGADQFLTRSCHGAASLEALSVWLLA